MTKKKNKTNPLIYVVMVLSLISLVFVGFNIYKILTGETISIIQKDKNQLENKFYKIGNNATQLQKDIFIQLTEAINKGDNDLLIADLVAQSFAVDLFTWSNKDGNYEIGGQQYVYGSALNGFNSFIKDTLYSELDLYIAQYGREYLPQIKSIESNAMHAADFTTYFGTYPAFYVELTWQYEDYADSVNQSSDSKVVNTSEFQNKMFVYLIKTEEGRFEVVQFFDEF